MNSIFLLIAQSLAYSDYSPTLSIDELPNISKNILCSNISINVIATKEATAQNKIQKVEELLEKNEQNKETSAYEKCFVPEKNDLYTSSFSFKRNNDVALINEYKQAYIILDIKNTVTNTKLDSDLVQKPTAGKIFSLLADGRGINVSAAFKEAVVSEKGIKLMYTFSKDDFTKITKLYIAQTGVMQKISFDITTLNTLKYTPVSDFITATIGEKYVTVSAEQYGLITKKKKVPKKPVFEFKSHQYKVQELKRILEVAAEYVKAEEPISKTTLQIMKQHLQEFRFAESMFEKNRYVYFNKLDFDNNYEPKLKSYFRHVFASLYTLISNQNNLGKYNVNDIQKVQNIEKTKYCPFNSMILLDSMQKKDNSEKILSNLVTNVFNNYSIDIGRPMSKEEFMTERNVEKSMFDKLFSFLKKEVSSNLVDDKTNKDDEDEQVKKEDGEDIESFLELYKFLILIAVQVAITIAILFYIL